jgi:hypothetical protein
MGGYWTKEGCQAISFDKRQRPGESVSLEHMAQAAEWGCSLRGIAFVEARMHPDF